MSKLSGKYSGSTEFNGYIMEFSCYCECDYTCQSGRAYLSNGDPGYDDEWEYTDIHATDIYEVSFTKATGAYIEGDDLIEYYNDHEPEIYKAVDKVLQEVDIDWESVDD